MKNILILLAALAIFSSCRKKSEIKVTNKVSNCLIENISFGDYKVPGAPITNESTSISEITDKKNSFPKKFPLVFYMVAKGNRVYLRTKEEFELKAGGQLDITLENNTPVQAP